jgi:2-iminobutanoate/2-iminopropanoate deaminase
MRQQSLEIEGIRHGAPIPMACKIGPLLMTSGVMGMDAKTGKIPEDVNAQAELCFSNLKNILDQAGLDWGDVIKIGVFMADADVRAAVNKPWERIYPDEHKRPARHAIIVPLRAPMRLQIEAFAVGKGL